MDLLLNRKLLLFVVLVVIFAVASSHNVFASTEIAYDDGTGAILAGNSFSGVRFSLPSGVSRAQIRTVRFAWNAYPDPLVIHITGPDHVTELTAPISVTTTSAAPTFQDVDVFDRGIVVSGDFYVVTERLAQSAGNPYLDSAVNYPRSFGASSLADLTTPYPRDLLIRVVIESVSPVGGVVLPTNRLTVLAPYLAMLGLVAVAATVYVTKRK
jgi:hypothetical protein